MLQPLGNRVLVEPTQGASQTPGGIIIPEAHKAKQTTGVVISIGPDINNVKAGETVLYREGAGTKIEGEGADRLLLNSDDLLAVVEL